jgi:hypothetical protein
MIAIWNRLKTWAALAGVALFAIGIAFLKGRTAGIAHIEAEQARRRLDAIKARKETDDEITGMDSTTVDDRLARWMRDDR